LRFLADNDTEAFKKILYVVILRDLAEWTKYMGNQDCVYDKLNNKINEFILRNPEFLIERVSNVSNYTNVNTPQTIFTWQRLWDSQDVIYNREVEDPERAKGYEYDPDPTCNVSIVYFNSITIEGEPDIDRSKLSTCEKMNIFINRNTGEAWYLRPDGNWDRLKSDID